MIARKIGTDGSFFLETEDAGQVIALGRAVIINRGTWRDRELLIQLFAIACRHKLVGGGERVDAGETQLFQ